MKKKDCDILIVGGGLSGLLSAYALSLTNLKIIIIDAGDFDINKKYLSDLRTTAVAEGSKDFFEKILTELKPYTKDIAFHVFGDPLTLSNLESYLDLSLKHNFKVHITTTGYYLRKFDLNLFLHKAIKQINFSLNSYNKNEMNMTLEEYLNPMFQLCDLKLSKKVHNFITFDCGI